MSQKTLEPPVPGWQQEKAEEKERGRPGQEREDVMKSLTCKRREKTQKGEKKKPTKVRGYTHALAQSLNEKVIVLQTREEERHWREGGKRKTLETWEGSKKGTGQDSQSHRRWRQRKNLG